MLAHFWKAAVVVTLAAITATAADPKPMAGKVTQVTLYRGQALVTRSVPLEGAKGGYELVVSDLPQQIVDGSLFAEAGEAVEVRAVRLRQRAVGQEPREEVRKLDLQILDLNDQLQLNQKQQELLTKRTVYLDGLEGFVAPTAKTELSKGVLNAEALEKISGFSFTERQKVVTEQVALLKEQRSLQEKLQLLQNSRNELTNGAQKTVNEALIFIEKQNDAAGAIQLNYLVNDCGWQPSYNFRAGKDRQNVEIEYSALIQQMTGEDWSGVALTLSTASPALSAAGPGLAPFYVTLSRETAQQTLNVPPGNQPGQAPVQQAAQLDVAEQYRGLKQRQSEANKKLSNTFRLKDNLDLNWGLNAAANDVQQLELLNPHEALSSLGREAGEEGPSLSYRLPGAVSLASRSDQQMVRILKTGLASSFYYVATPVLAEYVHREASVKNTSDHDLLGGPISVYLDGRFVGRAEIATVARGQTFTVGFGADPQLRTTRELLERKEGVQGGNRELTFKYRLAVENFSDTAATVRLFDRLPYGERAGDVRVALTEPKTALSAEASYVRTERPKGILRWDVAVPAEANLEKSHVVEYSFTVDYDRNFALTTQHPAEQQLMEFEQLQRARQIKK